MDSVTPAQGLRIIGFDANGDRQETGRPGCDAGSLEDAITARARFKRSTAATISEFVRRCEKETFMDGMRGLTTMVRAEGYHYDYRANRHINQLTLRDRFGFRIRALLALKPGRQKYPLVVSKCGIHCNLSSVSTALSLAVFHDEAPFHVLILPSTTGTHWQMDNKYFTLGGVDEGRQIIDIVRYMTEESRFASRIGSVHVVGWSLGGHAALYAGLYSEFNRRTDGSRHISSVFAGCPVVDLEASVRNLYRPTVIGRTVGRRFWSQMQEIWKHVPIIRGLLPHIEEAPRIDAYPTILERALYTYYNERLLKAGALDAPIAGQLRIRSPSDVWDYNRFQDWAPSIKDTPYFAWASTDDHIVSSRQNLQVLRAAVEGIADSPIQTLESRYGSHCAFQGAVRWGTVSSAMRGYILAHSPELLKRRKLIRVPLEYVDGRAPIVDSGTGPLAWVQWSVEPQKPHATLTLHYKQISCSGGRCGTERKHYVPLKSLWIHKSRIPRDALEACSLSRWLNASVRVMGPKGKSPGPMEAPTRAEWWYYGD